MLGGMVFSGILPVNPEPTPTFLPPANRTQVTNTPSPTVTATITPTRVRPTATIAVTPTATIQAAVLLITDTELGTERKFIIHLMQDGENLDLLSKRHNTSQTAILAITYKLVAPVWAGKMIVIPIGQKDVSDLPALQPYEVTQPEVTLLDLAQILGVSITDLITYNGCEDCRIKQGSWILVPRVP